MLAKIPQRLFIQSLVFHGNSNNNDNSFNLRIPSTDVVNKRGRIIEERNDIL